MSQSDPTGTPPPLLREWARSYRQAMSSWQEYLAHGGDDPNDRPLQERQRLISGNWMRGRVAAIQTLESLRVLPPYPGAEDFQAAQEEQFRELAIVYGDAAKAALNAPGDTAFERIATVANLGREQSGSRLRNTVVPTHVLEALQTEGLYRPPTQWERFTNWLGSWQGLIIVGVTVATLFFGFRPFGMDLNPFDDTKTVTIKQGIPVPMATAGIE